MSNLNRYYVTYHESSSGVFKSQVIDTVEHLNNEGINFKLVSFLSIRGFWKGYRYIKRHAPSAIVIPAIPKQKLWKLNSFVFKVIIGAADVVICRGIFSTNIALESGSQIRKVIYDGRGAIFAESKEYNPSSMTPIVREMEERAILNVDYRIAVSEKLVEYWKDEYGYLSKNHIVIPCTLGLEHDGQGNSSSLDDEFFCESENNIYLVYSGSLLAWQSFELLFEKLQLILDCNSKVKVLFLSKPHNMIDLLAERYKERIAVRWLAHSEVAAYLGKCDYGLLIRDDTTTNQVSSPVKFAEYLSAGLDVIISPNIGDFSQFVKEKNCGTVLSDGSGLHLRKVKDRKKNQTLCKKFFSKYSEGFINKFWLIVS